jgi:hypothetical protein
MEIKVRRLAGRWEFVPAMFPGHVLHIGKLASASQPGRLTFLSLMGLSLMGTFILEGGNTASSAPIVELACADVGGR